MLHVSPIHFIPFHLFIFRSHGAEEDPKANLTKDDLKPLSPPLPSGPGDLKAATHSFSTVVYLKDGAKEALQHNRISKPFCPPSGQIGFALTLALTTVAIFLSAWTMLGPIAGPGGTVFALLMLILLGLVGGFIIKMFGVVMSKIFGINICLPPLLGMLLVGILLKNIPYNIGQFGRAECTADHKNAAFVDSIHQLDSREEHSSFKRSISQDLLNMYQSEAAKHRVERSVAGENLTNTEPKKENQTECTPKYIGHEIDPKIARSLRTLCLTVILLRAGLEMDPVALWKLSGMVMRATFIPCFVEATAVDAL